MGGFEAVQEVSVHSNPKSSEFWNFCSSGTGTTLIGTGTKAGKLMQYHSGIGTTLIDTGTHNHKSNSTILVPVPSCVLGHLKSLLPLIFLTHSSSPSTPI